MYLKKFSERCTKYGINLYSCSENSRTHDFLQYHEYTSVISQLEKSVLRGKKLVHSKDAEDEWKAFDQKADNKKLGNGPQI